MPELSKLDNDQLKEAIAEFENDVLMFDGGERIRDFVHMMFLWREAHKRGLFGFYPEGFFDPVTPVRIDIVGVEPFDAPTCPYCEKTMMLDRYYLKPEELPDNITTWYQIPFSVFSCHNSKCPGRAERPMGFITVVVMKFVDKENEWADGLVKQADNDGP